MANSLKLLLPVLVFGLVLQCAIADETISDDDLFDDQLLPKNSDKMLASDMEDPATSDLEHPALEKEAKESSVDREDESPMDEVEEPPLKKEEEEMGEVESSGDSPILDVRSYGVDALPAESEEKTKDAFKCQALKMEGGSLVLNCRGGQLVSLPEDLDLSVTILDLGNNSITDITSSMFPDKLENVETLDLSNNFIKSIDTNAFSSFPRLEEINLSGNALTTLDPETFSGLPALSELDLGGNPLQLPAATLFLNVPKLRRLRMVNCDLQQLPESTFDGMASLEDLDLGNNPIADETPIVTSVFAALTNLSALTLPKGASPALITEVCRSHGLLPAVCLGTCTMHSLPCHLVPVKMEVKLESNEGVNSGAAGKLVAKAEVNDITQDIPKMAANDPPEEAAEDPATDPSKKSASRDKGASSPIDDQEIPASSRSGVTGAGANKTIIGIVIGCMLAGVAGVIIKKNWSKIRGKRDEGRRTGAGAQRPQGHMDSTLPEEVPLQNKTPPV